MDVDYIIVQAGGKGTRMQHMTKNKPKALVPVGNLPMIFHLFSKFPNQKYIIIADYKVDVMRRYLAAFCDYEYILVDSSGKTGTCADLKEALGKIPDKKAFMLIWSDLVLDDDFEFPQQRDDYIGLAKDFMCRWRYEDSKFEEIPSDQNGVAGLFIFKDKERCRDVPQEGELVKWMQMQGQEYEKLDLYKTREYGVLKEYQKTEQEGLNGRCRPFNRLEVKDGMILKKGITQQGKKLAEKEKNWYRYVLENGFTNIPKIYDLGQAIKMSQVNGKNIYEYGTLEQAEKEEILEKTVCMLKKLHQTGSADADQFSVWKAYVTKTWDRLKKIRELIPYADKERIIVNGRSCRNVFFIKHLVEEKFFAYHCEKFCVIHGDNTFSNMLLDEKRNPVLIDPRGYFGNSEIFGDAMYDWAKLYYSIRGNYDQFNLGRFRLEIKEDRPCEVEVCIASNHWEDMEERFFFLLDAQQDHFRENIKLIHAIIWLSLTTYAWQDYDSICGAFYMGLYYLEEALDD